MFYLFSRTRRVHVCVWLELFSYDCTTLSNRAIMSLNTARFLFFTFCSPSSCLKWQQQSPSLLVLIASLDSSLSLLPFFVSPYLTPSSPLLSSAPHLPFYFSLSIIICPSVCSLNVNQRRPHKCDAAVIFDVIWHAHTHACPLRLHLL